METLPIELQHIIFFYINLTTARLIYKQLTTAFNPQLIQNMHHITKEHRLDYYNDGNNMVFYQGNNTYLSINFKLKISGTGDYHIAGFGDTNLNIKTLLWSTPIDLMSTYNILKKRDIYKTFYAKNRILFLLNQNKLMLYAKSSNIIKNIHMFLLTNAYLMGLRSLDHLHEDAWIKVSDVKSHNITLYKEIEQHIKDNL